MYYPADSVISEDNMAENKGFNTSNFGDYNDMDSEVNYQDLFSSTQDQAVVSKVNTSNNRDIAAWCTYCLFVIQCWLLF